MIGLAAPPQQETATGSARTRTPLTRRARLDGATLQALEQEAVDLFHRLKVSTLPVPWKVSPLQDRYVRLREALLLTPGILRGFRHSFLAGGRLNFPDAPRPKNRYLFWEGGIPRWQKWPGGAWHLLRMALQLRRHSRFHLRDVDDPLVGQPSAYAIPASAAEVLLAVAWRLGLRAVRSPVCYYLTEAQLRFFSYRTQISALVGDSFDTVLEVGGGYGGLAGELLEHLSIRQYLLLELPETVPLAYFYLRASFEHPVQVLYRQEDVVDPEVRIVLLAPWMLPRLEGDLDVLLNTMSFQHMTRESLAFYFLEAERLKTRWIYLVNRESTADPEGLVMSDYPIPGGYAASYRQPWRFYRHYLEAVYQRAARPD